MAGQLVAAAPTKVEYRKQLGDGHVHLGMARYWDDSKQSLADLRQTLELFRKALSIHEPLVGTQPANVGWHRWAVGADYEFIGKALQKIGDVTGDPENYRLALENHSKELEINQALSVADPGNASYRDLVGVAHMDLGGSYLKLNDAANALEHFLQYHSIAESLAGSDSANLEARREIAESHQRLGQALALAGDIAAALDQSREALARFTELVTADSTNAENRTQLIEVHNDIGHVLERGGSTVEALENYRKALALLDAWLRSEPANSGVRRLIAIEFANIGKVYAATATAPNSPRDEQHENWDEARLWYERSLMVWEDLRTKSPLGPIDARHYAEVIKEITTAVSRRQIRDSTNPSRAIAKAKGQR